MMSSKNTADSALQVSLVSGISLAMRDFLFTVVLLLVQVSAFGETIEGYLSVSATKDLYIVDESNSNQTQIVALTEEASKALKMLKANDYLVIQGESQSTDSSYNGNSVFLVSSVLNVGLQDLIGVWNDSKLSLVFTNYAQYFVANASNGFSVPTTSQTYSISPVNGEWMVFFSENKDVKVAHLKLGLDQLELSFVNSETGDVSAPQNFVRSNQNP